MTLLTHRANALICAPDVSDDTSNRHLVIRLGTEQLGFELCHVKEIIELPDFTPVAHTPRHIKGFMNQRGKIIPVIELRSRLGMRSAPTTEETCVVVVSLRNEETGDFLTAGVIVDSVSEVLRIAPEQIQPAPRLAGSQNSEFFNGLTLVGDKLIALLDVSRVIGSDDLATHTSGGSVHY